MATLQDILKWQYPHLRATMSGDDYASIQWIGVDEQPWQGDVPSEAEMRALSDSVDLLVERDTNMTIDAVQFRRQLRMDGRRERFAQLIAAASEAVQDYAEYSPTIRRNHPLIEAFAPALGYDTPEKIDNFFRAARQIGV